MKLLYGNYALDMNCAEFDIFLSQLHSKVVKENANQINGVPLYTLDEYKANGAVGYSLLGDETKQSVVGVAYKSADLSRIWFLPTAGDKHTMFIDGYPDLVTKFDLIYEDSTGHLISPINDNKIVLDGTEFK